MAAQQRFVLLGKTGMGKSSLANTILGESLFETSCSADSETSECQTMRRDVHRKSITVTDTPGFFDSRMTEKKLKPAIIKCIIDCSPGPHAFIIVLSLVERFTDHENEIISKIKKYFSEEVFKYAVAVFTYGEQLPDNMTVEDFFGKNEKLRDLLQKCGNRYHVVDNKYWNNQQHGYRSNKVQVADLLNTIDRMIEANGGGYYTNEMFQEVERMIQHVLQSLPQHMKPTIGQAKDILYNFLKNAAGLTTGALLGGLLGVPVMMVVVVAELRRMDVLREVEAALRLGGVSAGIGRAAGAAVTVAGAAATVAGAAAGAYIGYDEATRADSVGKAVVKAAEAVISTASGLINKP